MTSSDLRSILSEGLDLDAIVAQMDAERANALGGLRKAADARGAHQEEARGVASENLLSKALIRLAAGDEAAAKGFVERTLRLEYTESGLDGVGQGELGVSTFIWNGLRGCIPDEDGDDVWLDRAQEVLSSLKEPARLEWLGAMVGLADGDAWPSQRRRLDRLADRERYTDRDPFVGVESFDVRVQATLDLLRGLLVVLAD